jgi:HEAT repeat protein
MHTDPYRSNRRTALGLIVILGILALVAAQTASVNPVEELRQVLKAPAFDLDQRNRTLGEQVKHLDGLSDLRSALTLREWRDEDPNEQLAAVDQVHRATVARRFEQAVREVLHHGDTTSRLAVLNILAKMGTSARGVNSKNSIASGFASDLAGLVKQGDPGVCEAAARALGQINPDPEVAVGALSALLTNKPLAQRLAAADGLVGLMKTVGLLAAQSRDPRSVEASRVDVVKAGGVVVPLAARWLRDEQPEIRRKCAEAIGQAALALNKLVLAPRSPDELEDRGESRQLVETEQAELLPLIRTLKDQGPALTRALTDSDAEVRFLARQALEDMTGPQLRLLERAGGITREGPRTSPSALSPSQFVSPASHRDPILEGLHTTALALADGLHEPEVRARRAAIDVLETMGPAAAPAASALVAALADADPFVRWAAARTLGKISPVAADTAVPGLVRLLADLDLDLRKASLVALGRYGPAAKTAVPDLTRAMRYTDADLRMAAIQAVGAVGGPEAYVAIPALVEAVTDTDDRVRLTAIEVLGKFGAAAADAVEVLNQAMQDSNPEIEKAAGEALLSIKRPGRK